MAYQNGRRARGALLSMTALLALAAVPAHAADQFKQAADGAGIECSVSARELTRFALIDDQFASVSKISTGTPYNDFAVTNEPLRGDIYISVPETFAAGSISFFATTRKGYVYKVIDESGRVQTEWEEYQKLATVFEARRQVEALEFLLECEWMRSGGGRAE